MNANRVKYEPVRRPSVISTTFISEASALNLHFKISPGSERAEVANQHPLQAQWISHAATFYECCALVIQNTHTQPERVVLLPLRECQREQRAPC